MKNVPEIAKRASRWLLVAAALQVSIGVFAGPVLFGALAAGGAVWLFLRSRPHSKAVLGAVVRPELESKLHNCPSSGASS